MPDSSTVDIPIPIEAGVAAALDDTATRALAGIALMLGAAAAFAALDTTGKWLNQTGDPVGTAAVRYVLSFVLVGLFINPWGRAGLPRSRSPVLQVTRAGFLIIATVTSMTPTRRCR